MKRPNPNNTTDLNKFHGDYAWGRDYARGMAPKPGSPGIRSLDSMTPRERWHFEKGVEAAGADEIADAKAWVDAEIDAEIRVGL